MNFHNLSLNQNKTSPNTSFWTVDKSFLKKLQKQNNTTHFREPFSCRFGEKSSGTWVYMDFLNFLIIGQKTIFTDSLKVNVPAIQPLLPIIPAFVWTHKQTVSPSPGTDGLWLQTDSSSDLHHQPSLQSLSEASGYYFRYCIEPVLLPSCQGSKGREAQGLSRKEDSSTATKTTSHFFPHLRQLRLRTCFSLYRQAPGFLVCFTIFPVTLRTPGSYSNIRSQIRSFKFTAHMLHLTLLRDPNTTTPKETCSHFTLQLPFSFSGTEHSNSHSCQAGWGQGTGLGVLVPNFTET